MRVRFGRWTGQQKPFPAGVSADDVLDELSDDLLGGLAPDQAVNRLLRRGIPGRFGGLDALRRRVEEARRRELSRLGLEGPLRAVERRLAEIVERERRHLEFSADPGAGRRREQLDALPDDPAGKLSALARYDWADAQAARAFRELLDALRRDVAEATFGRLAAALDQTSDADVARLRDLLADLNAMIAKREAGGEVAGDFAAFKQRYGDVLPGDPDTLDELLEELARRMAAMSRLMAGLDPDQRAQLAAIAGDVLDDVDLAFQASALRSALERAFPGLGWDEAMSGAQPSGAQAGSLSSTVDWVEHLQAYEDLAAALRQDYPGARLDDVDEAALRDALGEDAVRDLSALRDIERTLEAAGAARRRSGALELTPRGIRRLGERCVARIYERAVTGPVGSHPAAGAGGEGELVGSTRPLRFGDPFRVDVARTVHNATLRRGPVPARSPGPVLEPDDFELAEAEQRVRAATVLLLDMSFSMPLRGNWVPAKRLALALSTLVASRFPEDRLWIVGFSDYARQLAPRELLATGWERVYGTNMQHAFLIARRLLSAHAVAERQVIMVTDGEPTAHLDAGVPMFAWPPEPETLRLTLVEAGRLARTGATLNVFLLDHDPGAAAFVERMVAGYGGRIFYPDLDDLGSMVVRDFLRSRRAA